MKVFAKGEYRSFEIAASATEITQGKCKAVITTRPLSKSKGRQVSVQDKEKFKVDVDRNV